MGKKIFNTCILPERDQVERILDEILPQIDDRSREAALLMTRICEWILRSRTFALNAYGKRALVDEWIFDLLHFDDLRIENEFLQMFKPDNVKHQVERLILSRVIERYCAEVRETIMKDQIDADVLVEDFREERIKERWPIEKQKAMQQDVLGFVHGLKKGGNRHEDIFQDYPLEPTDSFRERFANW